MARATASVGKRHEMSIACHNDREQARDPDEPFRVVSRAARKRAWSSPPGSLYHSSSRRRHEAKARLSEVRVQRECLAQSLGPHELDADAIDEAQASAVCSEEPFRTPPVEWLRDPCHGQHRDHVLSEVTNRVQAESVLQQSDGLNENIRRGPERMPAFHDFPEHPQNIGVSVLAPNQQCVES